MTDVKLIIGNKRYSSWSLRGWLAMKLSGMIFEEVLGRFYSRSVSLDETCQAYFDALWALPEFVEWRDAAAKEEWTITSYDPK